MWCQARWQNAISPAYYSAYCNWGTIRRLIIGGLICLGMYTAQGMAEEHSETLDTEPPVTFLPLSSSLTSTDTQLWHFASGIAQNQVLQISGHNRSNNTARLLVRIDHKDSTGYNNRFNLERTFLPGPFTLSIALNTLKSARGAPFPPEHVRRIYLNALGHDFEWHKVSIKPQKPVPDGLYVWDFGPPGQRTLPGAIPVSVSALTSAQGDKTGITTIETEAVIETEAAETEPSPASIQLEGAIRYRDRPYHDPLIADGIEGLSRLSLPLPNGLWQIRLWMTDPGEWEYLPHALERAITVNGQPVFQERLTPEQWQKKYYQADANRISLQEDAGLEHFWRRIAAQRGQPIDARVRVTDGQLTLAFSSPDTAGRFISALAAAPLSSALPLSSSSLLEGEVLLNALQEYRKQLFIDAWSWNGKQSSPTYLPEAYQGETRRWADNEAVSLLIEFDQAPGELETLSLPLQHLQIFRIDEAYSRTRGQDFALQRETVLHNLTERTQANASPYRPVKGERWLITGLASRPQPVNPIPYFIRFSRSEMPVAIQWLNVTLPPARRPVGIYLDYAPHLSWFSQASAQQQAHCDYTFLNQFGLTGVAPALPTPVKGQETRFKSALQAPLQAGLLPPFPAYTPVKRLLAYGEAYAMEQLSTLAGSADMTLWSLADEPGLFLVQDKKLNRLNQQIQTELPGYQRMGQLNHSHHDQLLHYFDAVLINHGYSLTSDRIQSLKDSGKTVYLYNLPDARWAGGAYLWRTGLKGYWQWHGRMPTAHPADPTDGRENDVQLILPAETLCAPPSIHSRLLGLRIGINDLRWLNWLTQNAKQHFNAAILEHQIKTFVHSDWIKNTFNNKALDRYIRQIKILAQELQSHP